MSNGAQCLIYWATQAQAARAAGDDDDSAYCDACARAWAFHLFCNAWGRVPAPEV